MSKQDVIQAINVALHMKDNEVVPLEFTTRGARESFRVQFAREKEKILAYNPESDLKYLYLEAKIVAGKNYLFVKRGERGTPEMSTPVIYNPETGEMRTVDVPKTMESELNLPFNSRQVHTRGSKQEMEMMEHIREKYCRTETLPRDSDSGGKDQSSQDDCDFSGMTDEELQAYLEEEDSPNAAEEYEKRTNKDLNSFKEESENV